MGIFLHNGGIVNSRLRREAKGLMTQTATDLWYQANYQYLVTAVTIMYRALEGHQARKQNQPIEAVPGDSKVLDAIASAMSTPPALEQLCTTFNLSSFERNVLLLGIGMALLPNFPSLCANAHGNLEMPYPTFGLALEVFPQAHWSAFTPQAPLRRWQLLQVGTGQVLPLCPLQIDESVLHYLMGEPYQDQRLLSMMQTLPVADGNLPLQPSHQHLAERIAALLNRGGVGNGDRSFSEEGIGEMGRIQNPKSTLPIVQLCGSEIAAKWEIAATGCALVGRPLKVMSARRLPVEPEELHHLMQRWEREDALTNGVLLLDCEQVSSADTALQTAISQLIQETNTSLIITTAERLYSARRALISLDVPKLSHSEQQAIWQSHLGTAAVELNGHVEALVSQFNLSTHAIQAACLAIKSAPPLTFSYQEEESKSPIPNIQNQLWDICRTMARPHLDDLAQRIDSTATWDDLVLPEPQKNTLRDISTHVRQRTQVYQAWGFAGKGGRGLGISALFSGASGTGKTMAAEVLAKEFQLDLYRIDLSAVVSKYIGETEKNLRRIFDAAEAGGAILLFDEADALFGKRSEVKDSHDRHANVEVSYLLQRMEAYQGLAILTTNLKGSLDQAFLRRIRFVVPFPFPDATGRAEIWRRIFPQQAPTEDLEVDKLAKLSVAGEISAILL